MPTGPLKCLSQKHRTTSKPFHLAGPLDRKSHHLHNGREGFERPIQSVWIEVCYRWSVTKQPERTAPFQTHARGVAFLAPHVTAAHSPTPWTPQRPTNPGVESWFVRGDLSRGDYPDREFPAAFVEALR